MQSHGLFRLASKVWNTPHLINPEAFRVISDYFVKRNSDAFRLDPSYPDDAGDDPTDNQYSEAVVSNGVGVLCVDGSLTYKPVMTMCGEVGTSYQQLIDQTREMAAAGIKTIVMEVSSGGGQA